MKLVMTLLARDEADIVDAQIAFHLNAGVDFVVATDNRSVDGTTEILESYAREGYLHLIRESSDDLQQGEWVTRMARLAATEFGADWVINSDADEFWWPRGGNLQEVLASVPDEYGIVGSPIRHFPPVQGDEGFFAERMTVRFTPQALPDARIASFRPGLRLAHRADPRVSLERGNRPVTQSPLLRLRGWHPIEVLHFPLRSSEQAERKSMSYDALAIDDDALARGLEDGSLVWDTRLRDALRDSHVPGADTAAPYTPVPLSFPRPNVVDEAALAVDVAVVGEANILRLQARMDYFEQRLATIERRPWPRLRRRLSRFGRRG